MPLRTLALALTLVALAWAVVLFAAPRQLTSNGSARLAAIAYAVGAAVCHQRPDRSFHVDGVRLPVCARCTGLYLAGAAGLLAGWAGRGREPRRSRALLAVSALPMVLSVAVEWVGLTASSNAVRAATGVPAGAAAGWVVVRMLRSAGRVLRYHHHF